MEKICGIYKITSPTNKVYIGESVDITRRFKSYNNLQCKNQKKLYSSLIKHGVIFHTFEIIEHCAIEELKVKERYWQDYYNVIEKNGLNLKLTETSEKKQVHSEETLFKMRGVNNSQWGKKRPDIALRNKKNILKGEKHPNFGKKGELCSNFGKKWSEEKKLKQSMLFKEMYKSIQGSKAKIILCFTTGIFYNTVEECAKVHNIKTSTLRSRLNGNLKNNTQFNYV